MGTTVEIQYAYWCLSDQLININPNLADGRTYPMGVIMELKKSPV